MPTMPATESIGCPTCSWCTIATGSGPNLALSIRLAYLAHALTAHGLSELAALALLPLGPEPA